MDVARGRVASGEGQQPLTFIRQAGTICLAERPERRDDEGRGVPLSLDRPDARDEPVDQERAVDNHVAMLEGDYPGSIVVAEDQVVVFRQESRRGRPVGIGEGTIDYIEQLAAALVPEGAQPGPKLSTMLRSPLNPDHAAMSETVAGPKAAR